MLTPRVLTIYMLRSEKLRCWPPSLTAAFADIVGMLCRNGCYASLTYYTLYGVVVFPMVSSCGMYSEHVSAML